LAFPDAALSPSDEVARLELKDRKRIIMNKPNDRETDWKQDFPTYSFEDKEIVLREYDSASRMLESEERVFITATNLIIAVATVIGALTLGSLNNLVATFSEILHPIFMLIVILIATFVVSFITLMYLAYRQRAVILAAWKVIVLRRMLGLSYGPIGLVLPSNSVQGADDPFEIRMFPGWKPQVAYPFWIVVGFSTLLTIFLLAIIGSHLSLDQASSILTRRVLIPLITMLWVGTLATTYRSALFETHDDWVLIFARMLARVLRIRLVSNTEYVIYRATLGRYEASRLNVDLSEAKRLAVFIEDDRFYKHRGISIRGLARAILGLFGLRERSGGSTITMQLVRTLFIQEHHKLLRRKLLELILAKWLERAIAKDDILETYLVSVRYGAGVYGILAAINHFFGTLIRNLTPSQAFVLIERVSIVDSVILPKKIVMTLRRAVEQVILKPNEADNVINIYEKLVKSRAIINATHFDIERLRAEFLAAKPLATVTTSSPD